MYIVPESHVQLWLRVTVQLPVGNLIMAPLFRCRSSWYLKRLFKDIVQSTYNRVVEVA